MDVLVNTDSSVEGHQAFAQEVETIITNAISRFSDRVTRIEVHLTDENAQKAGADDKKCVIEARIAGRQPVAVTHHASGLHQAAAGAADKLKRVLDTTFGKLATH